MLFISSPIVCQKLNNWLLTRREMSPEDSAMFVNKSGGRLSIFSIENIYYKYRELSKINPHSTPHYLRHSLATQLLNNGANIRDVQESVSYTHLVCRKGAWEQQAPYTKSLFEIMKRESRT